MKKKNIRKVIRLTLKYTVKLKTKYNASDHLLNAIRLAAIIKHLLLLEEKNKTGKDKGFTEVIRQYINLYIDQLEKCIKYMNEEEYFIFIKELRNLEPKVYKKLINTVFRKI